jgi:hypothetical protein
MRPTSQPDQTVNPTGDRPSNQPATPADGRGESTVRQPTPQQPGPPVTTGAAPQQSRLHPSMTEPATTPATATGAMVALPVMGGLLALVLIAGVIAGWVARSATRDVAGPRPGPGAPDLTTTSPSPSPTASPSTASPSPSTSAASVERDRAALLASTLIDLADRITNEVLADRARDAIRSAGWTVVDPRGQPFDPDQHRAVDRLVTGDAALDRAVAATERPGYRDPAGNLVRPPEVIVYRYEPPSPLQRPLGPAPVPGGDR